MHKSKRTLLFFTGIYPFGRQEAFIENEIEYLSKTFDRVVILPQSIASVKRCVPGNVEVFPLPQIGGLKKSICIFINAISSSVFWLGLSDVIKGEKPFYRLRTLMSYAGLANMYRRYITNTLSPHIKDTDQLYLYSYWLDRGALTMVMLRDELVPKRVVSRVHGFDVYEERNVDNFLPLRKFILGNMDTIYSISDHAAGYLSARYPDVHTSYVVSRLGTTRESFYYNNIGRSVFHITSVSNVISLKRVSLILESILKFAKASPHVEIRWTHFGDGALFDELTSMVRENNATNLTIDLRGGRPNSEVKRFYSSVPVDLFMNLSISEGIPVSFMEAMSFGIPVLATDVGGVPEIVDDSCGWLLPKDVTSDLVASTLSQIVSNSDGLRLRSRRAMRVWQENYNADVTYLKFCNSIIGKYQ